MKQLIQNLHTSDSANFPWSLVKAFHNSSGPDEPRNIRLPRALLRQKVLCAGLIRVIENNYNRGLVQATSDTLSSAYMHLVLPE
jgi:hypothetical protein